MIYYENGKSELVENLNINACGYDIEMHCKRNGYYFDMDDMYNYYISLNEDCDTFEPYER